MVKERFIVNPFPELNLSVHDQTQLQDLANTFILSNLEHYNAYLSQAKPRVDTHRWKQIKQRENVKVYSERPELATTAADHEPTGSGLPMILTVGPMEGKLDDLMFGVVNEDLETMRVKASYIGQISGAAVLDPLVMPSLENPFQSLVLKWMELDIPLASTSLVKNRDYIYLEGTGYVHTAKGELLGYHLLHSVSFPQTHELPNRIRGNLSIVGFWRQIRTNVVEMYATGIMDPGGDMIRMLVVPNMASAFLDSLKYPYCGQMRKLAYMLEKAYADAKQHGTPNKKSVCVTCSSPISGRRLGDFGKSNSTCKLCFGFVCHTCKIVRKLSFVSPDLDLTRRKVTFCTSCIANVTNMSSTDVARAMMLSGRKGGQYQSTGLTMSSDGSSTDFSYASSSN